MPIYKKSNGKWGIENVHGESDSYDEAVKRLQAIKASQAHQGKSKKNYKRKLKEI